MTTNSTITSIPTKSTHITRSQTQVAISIFCTNLWDWKEKIQRSGENSKCATAMCSDSITTVIRIEEQQVHRLRKKYPECEPFKLFSSFKLQSTAIVVHERISGAWMGKMWSWLLERWQYIPKIRGYLVCLGTWLPSEVAFRNLLGPVSVLIISHCNNPLTHVNSCAEFRTKSTSRALVLRAT